MAGPCCRAAIIPGDASAYILLQRDKAAPLHPVATIVSGNGYEMVGAVRFELTTSCTPSKRATKLRYAPNH